MGWLTLLLDIAKVLFSGELQAWLKHRKDARVAQAVADAPTTKDELDETLAHHDF